MAVVPKREHYLLVCQNVRPEGSLRPSCGRNGAAEIYSALKAELLRQGLAKEVARACTSSCMDMCDEGPVIAVQPDDFFYGQMTVQRVPAIVKALSEGSRVQEFVVQTASLLDSDKDR